MRSITIKLNHLPDPCLSPNRLRTLHWAKRSELIRTAREEIGWLAKSQLMPFAFRAECPRCNGASSTLFIFWTANRSTAFLAYTSALFHLALSIISLHTLNITKGFPGLLRELGRLKVLPQKAHTKPLEKKVCLHFKLQKYCLALSL